MTGNKRRRGIVLQNRDCRLLSELAVMRIIDREMTKVCAGFGSTTQVSLRLLELTRAGFLRKFFVGTIGGGRKAVYTLSPKGADVVAARFGGIVRPEGKLVTGDRFVEHQFAINEIYLAVKYPRVANPAVQFRRWHTFRQSISEAIKLTPDGYFEIASVQGIRAMFRRGRSRDRGPFRLEAENRILHSTRDFRRIRATIRPTAIPCADRRELRSPPDQHPRDRREIDGQNLLVRNHRQH